MKQELKPCPFCGSNELSHGWSFPSYIGAAFSGNVECHSCSAFIIAETEAEAIAAWNRRANVAALEVENEKLRGLVRGWHYLAVGPDEMGDYYTHKQLVKLSEPYASPALASLAGKGEA